MTLTTREKQIVTALIAVDGIGRGTIRQLKDKLKKEKATWSDFWQNSDPVWQQKMGLKSNQRAALKQWQQNHQAETYFGSLQAQNTNVITIEDNNYPILLKNIDDPPELLFVKGPISSIIERPLAVVGTRNISGYGRQVCQQLIPNLVACGVTIVSGFMYGVDVTAQKAAHQHGGKTIGVLGFGFDQMYPRHQKPLFKKMVAAGQTFISEYPPHTKPSAGLFPERNRIVAGLSAAVLVVEAGKKSGSHITARLAGQEGRSLCAIPGPINSPFSEGTKWLINEGAKLVTSAQEIMTEAGFETGGWSQEFVEQSKQAEQSKQPDQSRPNKKSTKKSTKKSQPQVNFSSSEQQKIYQQLKTAALSTDELAQQTKLSITTINTHLSLLELKGLLRQEAGRWFIRLIAK